MDKELQQIARVIFRAAIVDKVRSESVIFYRKAINKQFCYPHFIIGIYSLIEGDRKEIDMGSVLSLYEFHMIKVQNTSEYQPFESL